MLKNAATELKRLPETANIVRYVGGSNYSASTGVLNGIAFERPPKDVDGLSVTQRLVLARNSEKDKTEIRTVFASRMTLGKTAVFAELNVGRALSKLARFDEEFFFLADPLPESDQKLANPAHALLKGLPFVGDEVGSLKSELAGDLLRSVVHDVFSAI
jgi:hypothetical protein